MAPTGRAEFVSRNSFHADPVPRDGIRTSSQDQRPFEATTSQALPGLKKCHRFLMLDKVTPSHQRGPHPSDGGSSPIRGEPELRKEPDSWLHHDTSGSPISQQRCSRDAHTIWRWRQHRISWGQPTSAGSLLRWQEDGESFTSRRSRCVCRGERRKHRVTSCDNRRDCWSNTVQMNTRETTREKPRVYVPIPGENFLLIVTSTNCSSKRSYVQVCGIKFTRAWRYFEQFSFPGVQWYTINAF